MTTLNIRIEENLKAKASKILSSLGIDMSSAVKMFLNQVVVDKGMPFIPTKNSSIIRARWDREIAEALKSGKHYKTAEELFTDIK